MTDSTTAKERLQQIHMLDIHIAEKKLELQELRELSVSIGSFDYARERVQTSPSGDATFVRTAEKAADIDEQIRVLEDERLEIIDEIRMLENPRHVEVLYKRYVECKRFEQVSREMNYALSYIWQLHGEALEAFGRL